MTRVVPEGLDTVIVGRILRVGRTDRGGMFHPWALTIAIDEQLAGAPLPNPELALYIHSPAQDFPGHIGTDVRSPDYTKALIGTRWAWGLAVSGSTITRSRRLFGLMPPSDAELATLRAELAG